MTAAAGPVLECRRLHHAYGPVHAIDGLDLTVPRGSLTAVLGPSGCGKTTLLRLVAGFERPDSGSIELDGRCVAGAEARAMVPARERGVGMVFQDYALFPHLDVRGNVGYGLGRRPDRTRVDELLALVGLAGLGERWPQDLSGGQQQRVALARALAPRPRLVLLDEPFSNLDARLRVQMRRGLKQTLAATGASGLLVTHDQDEALSLADHLVVMHAGRVEQAGAPEEVYGAPASRWAAEFLGHVNVLPGTAAAGVAETPLGRLADPGMHRGPVDVLVRPEALTLGDADAGGLTGEVVDREYFGRAQLLTIRLDGPGLRLAVWRSGPGGPVPGDRLTVSCSGPVTVLARPH